jgi:hypothetical protein
VGRRKAAHAVCSKRIRRTTQLPGDGARLYRRMHSDVTHADDLLGAMKRLQLAERVRRRAINDRLAPGVIRSRGMVGEQREALAAAYYGVPLAPASTPGYDLVTREGMRVQVKTLRGTPGNMRASIGWLTEPYDLMFAIRVDENHAATEAIEVPRAVVEELFGLGGRVTWLKRLADDARVRRIPARDLTGARAY